MEQKINIAELLKDCPKGLELDCVVYNNLSYDYVNTEQGRIYCKVDKRDTVWFTIYGCVNLAPSAKCVIFPKGKTTWEGFVPPCEFKDGDILISGLNSCEGNPFIFKQLNSFGNAECYCAINCYGELIFNSDNWTFIKGCRFATEEEKQKLFDAIKSHGYKWNEETKTLEKAIQPKFKVGDKIQSVISSSYYTVVDIKNDLYFIKSDTEKYPYQVSFSNEINYKLVLDKFNITTLKPFESRVLMRSSNAREWVGTIYSHYSNNKFYGCGMCCDQCIPYEGNEHLCGTTNDCDEYFKNW